MHEPCPKRRRSDTGAGRVRARKLRQRRWRCVTGAADRRRRDRRPALASCVPVGYGRARKAPLLICSGAASRRGLPYGGSTRFYGGSTRRQGHLGRFAGLRLRCGDCRAAAGGCHRASLMMERRGAAAAVRPWPAARSRLTALVVSAGHMPGPVRRPVLPPLFACGMRARPALAVLAWGGDGSPVWGCTTTSGDQVPLGHSKSP